MSEGVEVLEVDDDDDYFGQPGPSRFHQTAARDGRGLGSIQNQATDRSMQAADGHGIIDLEAEDDRPSSIRTSR